MKISGNSAIKQYLMQETRRLEESIKQYQERLGRVSPSDGDEGDRVTSLLEQSHNRTVLEQLHQQLRRLESARGRLMEGKYGICEDCDQAIPPDRLKAIPHATLCVRCQSQRERRRGPRSLTTPRVSLRTA